MQNREFENKMQQKMKELTLTPADAVWDKVEAGLREEKRPRRWIFFILFFAILIPGTLLLWHKSGSDNKEITENSIVTNTPDLQKAITESKKGNDSELVIDSVGLKTGDTVTANPDLNRKRLNSITTSVKIKIKAAAIDEQNNIVAEETLITRNYKKFKAKTAVKVMIKAPAQSTTDEEKNAGGLAYKEATDTTKTVSSVDNTVGITENKTNETVINKTDSSSVNKKDTAGMVTEKKEEKKKAGKILKWQYGVYVAAGSSNVTNELFSNTPVFANASIYNMSGSTGNQPGSVPNDPSGATTFSIGLFVNKNINPRWKFTTGINYVYQSNSIKVGSKVDTAVTLNFDPNKSISASNYYRAGNTTSYKNKFHLAEIPLLFQYRLSGKSPLYLEAGTTISYLVNSNALVYNNNSSSYITDAAIFNHLLLSANAGAGITVLQKSKFPFNIGYQFKYGIGSVVKPSFGKQHFVNSLFYLKVPFKK